MNFLEDDIQEIKSQGLFRSMKSVGSPQESEIVIDGKKVLNFCSNNYLGLANDPRLVQAAMEVTEKYGLGSGAARLISGNFNLYEELESKLSQFKGAEAALLFNSGYHANIGVIPALAGEGDIIFSDEFNHASLIDGCRLSKAKTVVFRHNDLNHLEELLKNPPNPPLSKGDKRGFLIVTEAVFSMEGDLCPLNDLLKLAEKYNATLYLDEAHTIGVFGLNGQGLAEASHPHLITMGTLGKAFGSYGAFVAGSQTLKDFLINRARSFIFTTALPPSVVGASLAALKIIQEEPERRNRLWQNIKKLESHVGAYGPTSPEWLRRPSHTPLQSPIVSLRIGPADKTMKISQKLLKEGIYLQGIRPPTVPEGTSRLRLTMTSEHSPEQIQQLVSALASLI